MKLSTLIAQLQDIERVYGSIYGEIDVYIKSVNEPEELDEDSVGFHEKIPGIIGETPTSGVLFTGPPFWSE